MHLSSDRSYARTNQKCENNLGYYIKLDRNTVRVFYFFQKKINIHKQTIFTYVANIKQFIGVRKELNRHLKDRLWTPTGGCQYGWRDFIFIFHTYIQLVMPLGEEWKSSPIRVDLQAVIRGEVRRVFKTKLVIILQRAVWIRIVLLWSSFNKIIKT